MAVPAAATQMTVVVATGAGLPRRRIASQPMPPTAPRRIRALSRAARMEALRQP